jgi:F-type H+-transporting ATPase subunit epsilon
MADKVQVELVTPTRLLLNVSADMVIVPGGEGDFGVLPGHAPLLSTVRPGTIEVHDGNTVTERVFVGVGFAEVNAERCTVLVQEAIPVSELSRETAAARLADARKALEKASTASERNHAAADAATAEAMLAALDADARRH